ncbi:hypothetical protein E2C01_056882 [Portunus trituberculatus]|uniref:Uncharacterized protein n=1 Tax=Portunus trituberculatus TaxID=210409 RepID=A0A5B7GVC6_PORTR|nr:hypothetical protein [Portunus trituberculatus]
MVGVDEGLSAGRHSPRGVMTAGPSRADYYGKWDYFTPFPPHIPPTPPLPSSHTPNTVPHPLTTPALPCSFPYTVLLYHCLPTMRFRDNDSYFFLIQ